MRRSFLSILSVLLLLSFTASVALASTRFGSPVLFTASASASSAQSLASADGTSLSLAPYVATARGSRGGSCAAPCTGLSLNAKSTLVGLGQANATDTLTAEGTPIVTCTTQGGNMAPGQNAPNVTISGQQAIGASQIGKNGTAPLDVTAHVPPELLQPLPGRMWGCPNDNWTAQITAVTFTQATIKIYQNGTVSLQQTFHF